MVNGQLRGTGGSRGGRAMSWWRRLAGAREDSGGGGDWKRTVAAGARVRRGVGGLGGGGGRAPESKKKRSALCFSFLATNIICFECVVENWNSCTRALVKLKMINLLDGTFLSLS